MFFPASEFVEFAVFRSRYRVDTGRFFFKMTGMNNIFGIHVGYVIAIEDNSFH